MLKLVRIDDENHQVIELSEGKQIIGREHLFDCEDKRISRNHAEIETTGDAVIIKALHTNPCFYINKEMAGANIIKQNCGINGAVGNILGFLPDKFWFEIVNKDINEVKRIDLCDFQPLKEIINRHKEIAEVIFGVDRVNETNAKDKTNDTVSEDNVEVKKGEKATEENRSDKDEASEKDEESPGSPSRSILSQSNEKSAQAHHSEEETSQTPGKRCLLKREPTSPIDIKKVKTDESRPQSSCSQASSSGASSDTSDTSPSKDKPKKRERCMYGANCYRKNPQHKAQFSHPADEDWGAGAQAPCPWGYACARRDPRHWRDHSHPYGMHPPPPAGVQKRRTHIVQRNGKRKKRVRKTSDEESPVDGLIVTGKRARKTVQTENWTDTESEEDPYQTDDSEDWMPPSDLTDSQDFSQLSQID